MRRLIPRLTPRHTGRRRAVWQRKGHRDGSVLLFLQVNDRFGEAGGRLWRLVKFEGFSGGYVVVDLFVDSTGIVH